MLEGGVDLLVDDLAGRAGQLGPHVDAVLAVALVHAVGDEGHPGGPALGDEDFEVGVAVQGPGGDQHGGGPLAPEGGLHVVEHRPAGTVEDAGCPTPPGSLASEPMWMASTSPASSAVAQRGSQVS